MKAKSEIGPAIMAETMRYVARNANRFPSPGAVVKIVGDAVDEWTNVTGADPAQLVRYFEKRPDGKFDFPPVNAALKRCLAKA